MRWLRRGSSVERLRQVAARGRRRARARSPGRASSCSSCWKAPLRPRTTGAEHRDGRVPARCRSRLLGHLLRRVWAAMARAHRGAVRPAQGGEQHAQVVVDLGDGPHGGAGMADGRALLDGDGRGEARHRLDLRLLHLLQELPGVGGQALDVAALALGVEGVEGQAALAGPGGPVITTSAVAGQVAVHPCRLWTRAPGSRSVSSSRLRSHGLRPKPTSLSEAGGRCDGGRCGPGRPWYLAVRPSRVPGGPREER